VEHGEEAASARRAAQVSPAPRARARAAVHQLEVCDFRLYAEQVCREVLEHDAALDALRGLCGVCVCVLLLVLLFSSRFSFRRRRRQLLRGLDGWLRRGRCRRRHVRAPGAIRPRGSAEPVARSRGGWMRCPCSRLLQAHLRPKLYPSLDP
jgi:hypothetical protein